MTLEDEGTTFLQNARNYSPNDRAPYPRRAESLSKDTPHPVTSDKMAANDVLTEEGPKM
jgi:hypothetical protein